MKVFKDARPFELECGAVLSKLDIAYYTYGRLNKTKDNVVWVCHAFTGSAEAADWWKDLIGPNKLFDPNNYFIVCANMLGSCYGSTGPTSINPATGKQYGDQFPLVTTRDMAHTLDRLAEYLGIHRIKILIGGSMGGQQAVEWAILKPSKFEHLILLASNAKHSSWGIAFNESQRMAIRADKTLFDEHPDAGKQGLETARAIAMLSYRNYQTYRQTQEDDDEDKYHDFRASSYQRYQGEKLWQRFDVWSYFTLSQAMDSHNVGRKRGGCEKALAAVNAKTLVISIQSDVLFPVEEQVFLANYIPQAKLEILESIYGHDGFLVEAEKITACIEQFLQERQKPFSQELHFKKAYLQGVQQLKKANLPGTETI